MSVWRNRAISAALRLLHVSGAHRLVAPLTRGLGVILTFHRVRPAVHDSFAPNAGLEISPPFLDLLLHHLRAQGYAILSLDDALDVVRSARRHAQPFAVLSFDDGYRDLVDHALPILERHRAPFIAYLTPGFADRSARLWWLELEESIRRLSHVDITVAQRRIVSRCASPQEKQAAFTEIYWAIRDGDEAALLAVVADLSARAGVDAREIATHGCLGWDAIRSLAQHGLATIGAHSLSHPRLARLDAAAARREMAGSRARIREETGVTPRHFCYPVGDRTSAGRREFDLAAELGFESAVTTRPGLIFPEHRAHLQALPRLSVNGRFQSLAALDVLLSGAPFALLNRGRRVAA
ncbi:polysaccharide deacetylase family protein [Methylocystis echinoides]|uniref:polysaccharide deacetylase family protein n=1 Tax=Methylocystis echinoides TaxID=29468 RepID=UPI0038620AED